MISHLGWRLALCRGILVRTVRHGKEVKQLLHGLVGFKSGNNNLL